MKKRVLHFACLVLLCSTTAYSEEIPGWKPSLIPSNTADALRKTAVFRRDFGLADIETAKIKESVGSDEPGPSTNIFLTYSNDVVGGYSFGQNKMQTGFGVWLTKRPLSNEAQLKDAYEREAGSQSQDKLRIVALDLVNKYTTSGVKWSVEHELYPRPKYYMDEKGVKTRVDSPHAGEYFVAFRQDLGNGIFGPSYATVDLYRDTIQIITFSLVQSEVSTTDIAKFNIAKSLFKEVKSVDSEFYVDKDVWMDLALSVMEEDTPTWWAINNRDSFTWKKIPSVNEVIVNFNGGEVTSHKHLHWPPVATDSSAFIFSSYFPSFLINVKRDGQKITLDGQLPIKGKKAELTVGSTSAVVDGKPVTLSGAPQEIEGRLYLPYELLSLCNGVLTRWEPKKNTLYVDTRYLRRPD